MKLNRIAPVILLALAGSLCAVASNVDTPPRMDAKQLIERAKEAKTADEHRAVARHYEARALEFDRKAEAHEQEVDRLAKRNRHTYNPLNSKWPAMVHAPLHVEKSKAVQARRAGHESRKLMAHHHEQAGRFEPVVTE